LLASTRVFEPASWARLQGHLNAGVGLDAEHVAWSEIRWGVGVDWGRTEEVPAAVAVRAVTGLSDTSTMRARPASSR
jgi:hypothetical protein